METEREVIIIVDDDKTNLAVARSSLADYYNVFTAPSGDKLFFLLKKIKPDLILLDIEMPDMNGYEVMKKLKSSNETAHIPVFFLTAKTNHKSENNELNLGVVDYITKPFSKELLIERINTHILQEKQKKELSKENEDL
jgi:putative two-component system response regulator